MTSIIGLMIGLLVAVAVLTLVAQRIRVPYPILLVIGGLLLSLVPGIPQVRLSPELIFVLFLPPLLYPAALFTSWRDFQANLRPILVLAVGLVLFTIFVTAWFTHEVMGLPWASAFVLGAIISPPDAVAATAITEHLRVPRRIVTILEGESLVNDATSFVAFRFAVAAVLTGTFSPGAASLKFLEVGVGGVLVGVLAGYTMAWIQSHLDDPPVQTTLSLLTPFATYLGAEALGVSGVLAVVVAGSYIGWRAPEIVSARMRLQAYPVWEMVVFILNGLVFILIGLQLPDATRSLPGRSIGKALWLAAIIVVVVIVVRILWVFAVTYIPRFLSPKMRRTDPYPRWRHVALVAWTGMRGADSLAAALAVPLTIPSGAPFPGRPMILFLTFSVIFGTLVLQGLSLAPVIRWLGLEDDHTTDEEERRARLDANYAAMARLEEIGKARAVDDRALHHLRAEYEDRLSQLEVSKGAGHKSYGVYSEDYEKLAWEALQSERQKILQLRNQRVISDEALRRIQRDIDLAEARLRPSRSHSH